MSANIFPGPAVVPVTDYEPTAFGGPPAVPPPQAAAPVTALRPVRRPDLPPIRPPAEDAAIRVAAVFADAALRRVLEVIDRRRPLSQLRGLMSSGLVDSLLSAAGPHGTAGPGRLRRVVARLANPDGTAAEVAAVFTRGERSHAIACRIEQFSSPTGARWQVVALHLG